MPDGTTEVNVVGDRLPVGSIDDVVQHGLCVGCGGCQVASAGAIPVTLMRREQYEPDLTSATLEARQIGSMVCPFSDSSRDEDEIAASVFGDTLPSDPRTGRYLSTVAGILSDRNEAEHSSSGGLTSWMAVQLLERDMVDGVILVAPSTEGPLFRYVVAESGADVLAARKSRYYPISFGDAFLEIRGNGKRYAFIGIPCQIKAARLIAEQDEILQEQLRFFVGLVCGHLKTAAYAESLGWQLGVTPDNLAHVDFRIKDPSADARGYRFGAWAKDTGEVHTETTGKLVGGNWGHAVFQLGACNYCDDIFAETADIVFGDAWLPKYETDWRGRNLVVTRNHELDAILKDGARDGTIVLDDLTIDEVAQSQAGNFRHRREGLAVRLADDQAVGRWAPTKRVSPGYDGVLPERVDLIRARRALTAESHVAYRETLTEGSIDHYVQRMRPFIEEHDRLGRIAKMAQVRRMSPREIAEKLLIRMRKRIAAVPRALHAQRLRKLRNRARSAQ